MGKQTYKLRHIALSVPDVAAAQKFFEEAFGMTFAGNAQNGVHMTDGTMNVALLAKGGKVPDVEHPYYGVMHFGMWVDDLDEAEKKVVDAGGTYLDGRPAAKEPGAAANAHSYYEAKYKDPLGIVFDLTHTGWIGAVKDVVAKN